MHRTIALALAAAFFGALAPTARAEFDFFFPFEGNTNGTISNNLDPTAKYTQVGIGFTFLANSPDTPFFPNETGDPCTVSVVDGGILPSTLKDVIVANQSTLNVTGSGEVDTSIDVYDTSSVNVNGGSITGDLQLMGTSSATVSEGSIRDVIADGNNQVTISGGIVTQSLNAEAACDITVTGGSIGGQLNAQSGGLIDVTGGSISSTATSVGDNTQITLSNGGTIAGAATQDGGTFDMTGGTIAGNVSTNVVSGVNGGTVSLSGVTVDGTLTGNTATISLDSGTTVEGMVTLRSGSTLNTSATLNAIFGLQVSDSSIVLNGGSIAGSIFLQGNSSLTGGATVNGPVEAEDTSVVTLTSGTVGSGFGESAIANGSAFMLNGATIAGDLMAFTFFVMQNGTITGSLYGQSNASLNIGGGAIEGNVELGSSSTAEFTAGSITGGIDLGGTAQFIMTGGNAFGGAALGSVSHMRVTGGAITGPIQTNGTSSVTINGGIITGNIDSFDISNLDIEGSQSSGLVNISGNITTHNNSSLLLADALVVGAVDADDSSSVSIDSGVTIVGGVNAAGSAHLFIFSTIDAPTNPIEVPPSNSVVLAGPLSRPADDTPAPLDEIFLYDQATLQINGLTFGADLLDPMNDGGMFSEYQLAGTFPDGSSFPADMLLFVQNGSGASFQFVAVPEPAGSGLLLSALGVGLLRRRRRSSAK